MIKELELELDWKNHPLVAAAIACASTAVFCISFVIPIYEKKNLNNINDLEKKVESVSVEIKEKTNSIEKLEISKKELDANLTDEIKKLKNEITSRDKKILKLQEEDRFSAETPLPKGFRFAAPFDPYDILKTAYKTEPTTTNKLYTSYKIEDNLFSSATYYHLNCNGKDKISHILFQFKDAYDFYKDEKNKDGELKMPPSVQDDKDLVSKSIAALLQIFREKYGAELEVDEDKHYFDIKKQWIASITDHGLIIYTALSDAQLNKACTETPKK